MVGAKHFTTEQVKQIDEEFISYSFLSEIGKRHIQLVYTSYPIILNDMNEDKARIRYAKATDTNDIIDLLEQLDRP